jgi:hypothetical protein
MPGARALSGGSTNASTLVHGFQHSLTCITGIGVDDWTHDSGTFITRSSRELTKVEGSEN